MDYNSFNNNSGIYSLSDDESEDFIKKFHIETNV